MRHQAINSYSQEYSVQSQLEVVALRLNNLRDNELNNYGIPNFHDHDIMSINSQSHHKQFPNTGHDLFERVFNQGNQDEHFNQRDEDRKSSQIRKKKHFKRQPVMKRKLQTINTKMSIKQKWNKCNKGQRYQTKNISNYLKVIGTVHQLTDNMKEEVVRFLYKKNKINLQVFNELFQCNQLRLKCLEYYQSNQFVCNLFKSRADIKTKIRIIKYLKKIERIPIDQATIGWKK